MGSNVETFTQELADRICEEIATGSYLKDVVAAPGMPSRRTVFRWIMKHPEFKAQYHQAQELRSTVMAEEILEIADDGTNDFYDKIGRDGKPYRAVDVENINRSRLRVDTRKWAMAHMWPTKYGDKAEVKHDASQELIDLVDKMNGRSRGLPKDAT